MSLLEKLKIVFWDYNGNLNADTTAYYESGLYVVKLAGGRHFSLKEFRNGIRFPVIDFYEEVGVNREHFLKNVDYFSHKFHKFCEERLKHVRSRKGANKVLRWPKDRNVESVVISNHTQSGIEKQIKRLGWQGLFSEVMADDNQSSSFKERTKEAKVRLLLKRKGISAKNSLISGDGTEEIKIGKALGMETVATTDGFISTKRLRAANPDHLITNLIQLIPIFKARL